MTSAESGGPDSGPGLVPTTTGSSAQRGRAALIGRRLRSLAGVDENLLEWIPGERARYTALGGVVLGTATIATISMTMALSQVLDGFNPLLLVPVLVWGLFILNLDRWLVSSSLGDTWGRRLSMLLPRLVLAFFFGVVIAEPLVLRIFEPAIIQHINDQRQQQLSDLEDRLLRCNPEPTDASAREVTQSQDCAGYSLNLLAGQTALAEELAGKQQEAAELRKSLTTDNAEQTRRDILASNECAGTAGPGSTGRAGRGVECLSREAEAAEFHRTHPVTDRSTRLEELGGQISVLQTQISGEQGDFQSRRTAAIMGRVDEMRSHQGPIGLLERFRALDELTQTNLFLISATWFMRLFFIAVDCLPVVVKFFGGKTRYEELLENRGRSATKMYEENTRTVETEIVEDLKTQQAQTRDGQQMKRESSDLDVRWHRAQLRMKMEQRISELADQMRRSPVEAEDAGPDMAASPKVVDVTLQRTAVLDEESSDAEFSSINGRTALIDREAYS